MYPKQAAFLYWTAFPKTVTIKSNIEDINWLFWYAQYIMLLNSYIHGL